MADSEYVGAIGSGSPREIAKILYSNDGPTNLYPDYAKLMQNVKFEKRIGANGFEFAVNVRLPQGYTFQSDTGKLLGFTLNEAVAGNTVMGRATSCGYMLQDMLPTFSNLAAQERTQAFTDLATLVRNQMVEKVDFDLEEMLMYGGSNIGAVQTPTVLTPTTATIVISAATWAPALWFYNDGGYVDIYSTGGTKRNATGTFLITAVNAETGTISLTGSVAGELATIVATDVVTPRGARSSWSAGLDYFITASAAGTPVLGINPATYGLWRASTKAISGTLTFLKIVEGAIKSMTKSGMRNLSLLLSPFTWTDVMNEQAALRVYQDQYRGEFENGAGKLMFRTASGNLTIEPYALCKGGEAFLVDYSVLGRIGTANPQWDMGEAGTGIPMESRAAILVRRLWDQALIARELAPFVKFTGITNSVSY